MEAQEFFADLAPRDLEDTRPTHPAKVFVLEVYDFCGWE